MFCCGLSSAISDRRLPQQQQQQRGQHRLEQPDDARRASVRDPASPRRQTRDRRIRRKRRRDHRDRAATAPTSASAPSRTRCPLRKRRQRILEEKLEHGGRLAGRRSVRHAVHDVVDADAKRHRRERLRILGIVGPFPGIAQMHVVADGHDDAALVVADGAPLRDVAVLLVGAARVARTARPAPESAGRCRTARERSRRRRPDPKSDSARPAAPSACLSGSFPSRRCRGNRPPSGSRPSAGTRAGAWLAASREGPALDLDGVDEGIVEDVVALEIDDLLVASRVDARQAPERREKRDVGLGIVARPRAAAIEAAEPAEAAAERRCTAAATRRTRAWSRSPRAPYACGRLETDAAGARSGRRAAPVLRPIRRTTAASRQNTASSTIQSVSLGRGYQNCRPSATVSP